MQQKNYRLLRFLQFALALLGWLCVFGAVLAFCGAVSVGAASGSADAMLVSLPVSFGLALSVFTVGMGYLIAAQLIEVFVDIAANSQRTAYLLEHMINHWPGVVSQSAPAADPLMPTVTMAQIPDRPPAT